MKSRTLKKKQYAWAVLLVLSCAACASRPSQPATRWWKGNLHTHSLWSDGTDFPEMIASWYRDQGYNFVAFTEHDMLQEGERWVDINAKDPGWPPRNESTRKALPLYKAHFAQWVQEREEGDKHLVRLRPLSEYRSKFERPESFLIVMGEEITDKQGAHVNAFNLAEAIRPRGGETTAERTRNNLAAIAEQRSATGRTIIGIVNHPNYVWTLKAEEITVIPDARIFEVYNGHKLVNNAGDTQHPGTEHMWDIILTRRHVAGGPPIYGIASDDAHDYGARSDTISRPGRGWVMVRAPRLTVEDLLSALSNGDFYASTGVTLNDVRADARTLRIEIAAQPGTRYHTTFIGTRRNSATLGEVFAESDGTTPMYTFRGDELYVRAKVTSSRPQIDPIGGQILGTQNAWTQPIYPTR